jgi:Hint domain
VKNGIVVRPIYWLLIFLIVALACNLPTAGAPSATTQPSANLSTSSAPSTLPPSTLSPSTLPPSTLAASTQVVNHVVLPIDTKPGGSVVSDVDSSGTASQNRAPYGDSYDLNLFERPFTQKDMTYLPNVDINTFQLSSDSTWYYVFVTLMGSDPNDPVNVDYGVEINKNRDGFGDTLIWAQPPYTTTWSTNGVKVYTDPNHDTGGASPEKSDAKPGMPYPGDGYETVIFNQGLGDDPDLAWVRINPQNPSMVEFAFKTSLAGKSFMWGVWADAGLKDPSKFNYNDRFTAAEAGSPIASNPNYPIKAIYAVDNTCWLAFGFKVTGYEPHLCPTTAPVVKKTKPGCPSLPPGFVCINYDPVNCVCNDVTCLSAGTLIDTPHGQVAVENLKEGDPVWTADATGTRIPSIILKTSRVLAPPGHPLIHIILVDGRELWASPGHPTDDGRTMGEIRPGDFLDGALVTLVEVVPSDQPATYDLLPSGSTGFYWANGILIGSTLKNH